ncbi:TPA: hypothetical protein ACGW67_005464 [Bacillus tropicus]
MKSNTAIVREEIEMYLKQKGEGVKIRQTDLTQYMLQHSSVATGGIVRGIYNRMQGIGGSIKPIPNVHFSKEADGKVFYFYKPTDNNRFSEDSIMGEIEQKIIEFEKVLRGANLLDISLLDLPSEERKVYLKFIDHFEELRNIFGTRNELKTPKAKS